jgi:hypothetical protein
MDQPSMTIWVPRSVSSAKGRSTKAAKRFPAWKGNFVRQASRAGAHFNEVVFAPGGPIGRESLLADLKQRVRDVRRGPTVWVCRHGREPRRDPAYRADTEIDFIGEPR